MTIPYYEEDAGIKHNEQDDGCYVILDKDKVDKMDPNFWNTFDAIRVEVQDELKRFFVLDEASICISPQGDQTYVLNLIPIGINTEGDVLQ